jgi:hypothetical protein
VAGLVDARGLGGGADEEAGEQVGQRGVVLGEGDEAGEQVGALDEGAVEQRGAAHGDVVAAAAALLAAVEHVLLGVQARGEGAVEDGVDEGGVLGGRGDGGEVDLEDAGVGGDGEAEEVGAGRRGVAAQAQVDGGGVAREAEDGDEGEELLGGPEGREEDVDGAVARFDAERGADLEELGALGRVRRVG